MSTELLAVLSPRSADQGWASVIGLAGLLGANRRLWPVYHFPRFHTGCKGSTVFVDTQKDSSCVDAVLLIRPDSSGLRIPSRFPMHPMVPLGGLTPTGGALSLQSKCVFFFFTHGYNWLVEVNYCEGGWNNAFSFEVSRLNCAKGGGGGCGCAVALCNAFHALTRAAECRSRFHSNMSTSNRLR